MLDNKEVELTFQLSENNWKVIENWLHKNSIFSGKSRITDTYLDSTNHPFSFLIGNYKKTIRVRNTEGSCEISFKDWQQEENLNYVSQCNEVNLNVCSVRNATLLMYKMGMNYHMPITKTRNTYIFKNFELVIDRIEGLGKFLEIEIIDSLYSKVENIITLLEDIGIVDYHIVEKSPLECLITNNAKKLQMNQ